MSITIKFLAVVSTETVGIITKLLFLLPSEYELEIVCKEKKTSN